ncbi:phosphotransferase system enzyme I (PtsI) [Arcanobacterium wilhelmae]|uniref:Phosphoenolpyruvate-protein phosphotransferase n=1 Tax=Arcanobacterium wilhelmae TaxID=1803177 RepID=A0ABT9ND61_9ACTO|nr:putative PEP-binding protein [Arcanobacterium wilhelmae]MDP9801657.1 phosphotransferase system enzyme I (PtsI) [Arcanobacterium wilhelmae]WFN90978.1 PEP-utilizing enzyme [Arcanobacterium wilhelmae]
MASTSLSGIGVFAGSAVAPAVVVERVDADAVKEIEFADAGASRELATSALTAVAEHLTKRAEATSGHAQEVLQATAGLATDRGLVKAVGKKADAGAGPVEAVRAAVADYAAKLEKIGGYMAERVTDLMDIRDRAVAQLAGLPQPGVPDFEGEAVIVADDLAPADTATLDPARVLAVVTEKGGPTSHTAILCAQLGIPAVVRASGAGEITSGTVVGVDGEHGVVLVEPTADEQAGLIERARVRAEALAAAVGKGETSDGHRVQLLVNLGGAEEAEKVAAAHSAEDDPIEGIGLFRTEFLYLGRSDAPSVEEQTETYRRVLAAFAGKKVVFRTLDAGSDKPLKFTEKIEEDNPALGVRGIRMCQRNEQLLRDQLEAIAAGYKAVVESDLPGAAETLLWVMAPMVADADEADWFFGLAHEYGIEHAGVMIETPAAAIRSGVVLKNGSFGSLGTNDLTQYTMAADRLLGDLAALNSPWQPAVLDMISAAVSGTENPIGVCGEAGGDPLLALVLTGIGVKSLSMAAPKVPAVRFALSLHTHAQCVELAEVARSARTATAAREAVLAKVDPKLAALVS